MPLCVRVPGCHRSSCGLAGLLGGGARGVVLGHSLGGVVGLALASGVFAVPVQAVTGLGIKIVWTTQDLDRARAAAHRRPAWFAAREQAAARYLRISGLAGLLDGIAQQRPRPRVPARVCHGRDGLPEPSPWIPRGSRSALGLGNRRPLED
jgi:hypothetical protein